VPTLKETKRAEAEAFRVRVRAALDEAHKAAAAAFADYKKTAKLTPEGLIIDACGGASVVVYKPSHRLRTTLKAMGELQSNDRGLWGISEFWRDVNSQSLTAHEVACRAARKVLERHFPGEGEFLAPSRMD
jgi:hypothetical protein